MGSKIMTMARAKLWTAVYQYTSWTSRFILEEKYLKRCIHLFFADRPVPQDLDFVSDYFYNSRWPPFKQTAGVEIHVWLIFFPGKLFLAILDRIWDMPAFWVSRRRGDRVL